MALSLNRVVNDLLKIIKKDKPPGNKETYWIILSEQFIEDGSWDEALLSGIKDKIEKLLESKKETDIKQLWEKSETAIENYSEEDVPELDTMIIDLKDELLEMILEKIEESNPREEYYTKYDDPDDIGFDDDDFDGSDFFEDEDKY